MSMFCYQCQETVRNYGCEIKGVCGKDENTSNLQDLLIYSLQGISLVLEDNLSIMNEKEGNFICEALFATITNANFDEEIIKKLVYKSLKLRDEIKSKIDNLSSNIHDSVSWMPANDSELPDKAKTVGINSYSQNEDIKSLKSLILYGLKGIAAYTNHAYVLGFSDKKIYDFVIKALSSIAKEFELEKYLSLVNETGRTAVEAMKLLDNANTSTFGNPEVTKVNIGVKNNPGILVSGHDLKDLKQLLDQTEGAGIDVYTHGEMLPANCYPELKKYPHLVGNYGGSWWKQNKEFESFNGPILMTTNCITPIKDSYKNRIFVTGMTGYQGVPYIPVDIETGQKDFGPIIELAKKCSPPIELEKGEIMAGFAHNQIFGAADKIVDLIKQGKIKRFVVMAGCDGRQKAREYFSKVAEALPKDMIILTAGCAKYRYNKIDLGEIEGIPRVLDAGQCNDSYSLAVVALKLKEIFELNDVNELPLSFDIAWYEQKAVAVLLALLYLGFKNIRLGPTVPAFLSPGVVNVLVEKFGIKPISEVESDVNDIIKKN